MKPEHIKVISEFLQEPELLDIHTYTGYKGGVICRFRTSSDRLLEEVHKFCEANGIECNSKFNHSLANTEIFIVAKDDVYDLRPRS